MGNEEFWLVLPEEQKYALEKYVIPKGYKIIKEGSFKNCKRLKQITIPNTVEKIEKEAFQNCKSLKKLVMPNSVKNIGMQIFDNCTNLEEIVFSDNITELPFGVFAGCVNLKKVKLPNKLTHFSNTFHNCKSLKNITLPKSLKKLPCYLFSYCESLKTVTFKNDYDFIPYGFFYNCSSLEKIKKFPKNLQTIEDFTFNGCKSLKTIQIPKTVKKIGTEAFFCCESLKKVILPEEVDTINFKTFSNCFALTEINTENIKTVEGSAFKNDVSLKELNLKNVEYFSNMVFAGCTGLEKLTISDSAVFGIECFDDVDFKYFYKFKGQNYYIFSKAKPVDNNLDILLDLDKMKSTFLCLDLGLIGNVRYRDKIITAYNKFEKSKQFIPDYILKSSLEFRNLDYELNQRNYKFFCKNIPNIKEFILNNDEDEIKGLYKLANILGCFSKDKLTDKNGKETETFIAQKACSVLSNILKSEILTDKFSRTFDSISLYEPVNQEFLKFISLKDENKNLKYVEFLLNKGESVLQNVAMNFDRVQKLKNIVDENGKPCQVSWEKAIDNYLKTKYYNNVKEEDYDIANLFASKGITQAVFDKVVRIRNKSKTENMNAHILNKPLKEDSILEAIEKVKKGTSVKLEESKKLIEELYNKKFTYEMLDKYDPKNSIIGSYASCCATINNMEYGRHITEATLTLNDVQNLVVKNVYGEIIAKGALYINKKDGICVINDFELNQIYKNHEVKNGYYSVAENHKEEQDRELIFNAFKRGIYSFVKEYDLTHKDNPIKAVVIGNGFNKLKKQCDRFLKVKELFEVPADICFRDAEKEQKFLYIKGYKYEDLITEEIELER